MSERDLVIEALQRTDPAERMAYLDQACAGDETLRRRVEELLESLLTASRRPGASAPSHASTVERIPFWKRGMTWVRRHPTTALLVGQVTVAMVALVLASLRYDAQLKAQARAEAGRVARLRLESEQALKEAQGWLLARRWSDSQLTLFELLTELKAEPRLSDIRLRAVRMLEPAEKALRLEAERRRDRERQGRFIERRNAAYFTETRFTGLDLPANVKDTRNAAREALRVFAADPNQTDSWTFGPLPPSLAQREQAEIGDGCYELLLILAEAVAAAVPGEDSIVQADRGLKLLDQAARLRPQPTTSYHRQRAKYLAQKGDEAAALRERAAADALRPTTVLDHFLAGYEGFRHQDWKTAHSEFETVLRMQPAHFWARCLSSVASLQTNQPGMARSGLTACMLLQPQLAWLYVLRGLAAGQSAVQARVAGRTLEIGNRSIEAEVEAQFDAAEDDYRQALELLNDRPNDELRYVVLVNRAVTRFQCNRLDNSVADLQEAIRLDGRRYNAFVNLAQVLKRQRKWDEAVEQLARAIALESERALLYRARAGVLLERDDQTPAHRAAALRDLEAATRYETAGNPILATDHTQRGRLLRSEGRLEDALAACNAALKLAPDSETAQHLRVMVLFDLNRPDEVIRTCDAVLARGKSWPDIYEIRGLARASRDDYPGAIEDYSHALLLHPDQVRLLSARGMAYLVSDSPRPALNDFDAVLRLDPTNGNAHSGRGQALALLGDYRAAVVAAEESLRNDPPTARRAYNAAHVYAQAASAAADKEKGQGDATLVDRYQDRAVALVKLALELTPAERRAAFWQDEVVTAEAFLPLQARLRPLDPGGAPKSPATNREEEKR